MLLSAGVAIHSTDRYVLKPIHLASMHLDRHARTALLVSAGANVEALKPLHRYSKRPHYNSHASWGNWPTWMLSLISVLSRTQAGTFSTHFWQVALAVV